MADRLGGIMEGEAAILSLESGSLRNTGDPKPARWVLDEEGVERTASK